MNQNLERVIRQGGFTALAWRTVNPILDYNEVGTESDSLRTKTGNGYSDWNNLAYNLTVPTVTLTKWGSITGSIDDQVDLAAKFLTKEDTSNKSTDVDADKLHDTKYPSVKAVYDWAIAIFQTASQVSSAISAALSGYLTSITAASTYVPLTRTVNSKALSSDITLDKTDVGLGNVDNTSDISKPVSTAQATAIGLKLTANSPITGATKTKITYDANGLVTSGADATTADIADSTNKRYVTDANLTTIGNQSGTNTGDNATNSQYSGLKNGLTLIDSGSLGTSSTKVITGIPATYAYLVLQITGASCDTTTRLMILRASTNNGVSYDSTAGSYVGFRISGVTIANYTSAARASLIDTATQTDTATFNATIMLNSYQGGANAQIQARILAGVAEYQNFATYIGSTNAIDALQIGWNASGNFDAGTYALYGYN